MRKGDLYEEDYNLWSDLQIAALKNRDVDALDWENLAADLDYPKYWIDHQLVMVISSLLELYGDFNAEDFEKYHWKTFVDTNRFMLNGVLEDWPHYSEKIKFAIPKAYLSAVNLMERHGKGKGFEFKFPDTCPFSFEQILEDGWYPA
ncbi:DUF29 domain-containing protein [Aphanothece sacrum]|uniref:DUF29 domain-containing protein n=1 Tax=Aphanothece sacrum FPU1 TaxID=1920663 RepID=A0A401IJ25_APHSA|nr:DUF29 domain-containing protein [Aphanothece sacrum]GBF81312.1 hypothetical protein AsFPU1_2725 [Aphanothece sacrum FPU1]GBF83339.1 hypothetical protein AsFPU3_0380 [Aphanothece sacrum FPU3]